MSTSGDLDAGGPWATLRNTALKFVVLCVCAGKASDLKAESKADHSFETSPSPS